MKIVQGLFVIYYLYESIKNIHIYFKSDEDIRNYYDTTFSQNVDIKVVKKYVRYSTIHSIFGTLLWIAMYITDLITEYYQPAVFIIQFVLFIVFSVSFYLKIRTQVRVIKEYRYKIAAYDEIKEDNNEDDE